MVVTKRYMIPIFEITTITGNQQRYEVIKVSPFIFANGEEGIQREYIEGGNALDNMASYVHSIYSSTGLDEAIKEHPARLITGHDGVRFTHAEIAAPERLRLVYDVFPYSMNVPILRIWPVDGKQIWLTEYDPEKSQIPLEKITSCQEMGGYIELGFSNLHVFIDLINSEETNREYYGRDLKKTGRREKSGSPWVWQESKDDKIIDL